MKKIIALLLALLMMTAAGLGLAETGSGAAEPEVGEVWDLAYMFRGEELMEEGSYPFISIFLYTDSTVRMESDAFAVDGTFEMTEEPLGYLLTFGDRSASCPYDTETGFLYILDDANDTTGVFRLRTDMPAELNAQSIDEFQGTWRVSAVIRTGSLVYLVSEAGQEILSRWNVADPIVTIEGSKVTVFGSLEGEAELVDGSLVVTSPNGEFIITLTEGDSFIFDIPGEDQWVSRMFADKV